MKYYVVSDIHGFYDQLIESLNESGYFTDTDEHQLIILGDLYDRGTQVKELESFVCDLIDKDQIILIRGNHEDLMEEFISNIDTYIKMNKESHHFRNSTIDTFCQLVGKDIKYVKEHIKECLNIYYKSQTYLKILPKFIDFFETSKYVFVHGYIPSIAFKSRYNEFYSYKQNWRKTATPIDWFHARWLNGMRLNNLGVREYGKTIVCGHWHASYGHCYYKGTSPEFGEGADYSPYYNEGIICIDGCVPRSNHINCIVIEDLVDPQDEIINKAVDALYHEENILLPTETVFGVANIYSNEGSQKLYELKNRPANKALPVCVSSYEMIRKLCFLSEFQEHAVESLLPGPITLILKLTNPIDEFETVAIRYSTSDLLNKVVSRLNFPIYLTSANMSGDDPITNIKQAKEIFKDNVKVYIDGSVNFNTSSTIVDLTENKINILREGPISLEEIEKKLGG